MGEGLKWALIELGGFIILIAAARLAAIYEASKQGAAKASELEGLIPQSDSESAQGGRRGESTDGCPWPAGVSMSGNCWPAKGKGRTRHNVNLPSERGVRETDPESLDE